MLKLAAFADEISPDLREQLRVCKQTGVSHIELRSVNNVNVLDFDPKTRRGMKLMLRDNGIGVCGIGSPIGKVKIDEPWEKYFDRFKIAIEAAEYFEAPLVRIFSYYEAGGHRDEVMRRMQAKVDYLRDHPGITLVHENEKDIFGERCAACVDLMHTINSPALRSAFDFANFVQAGEDPLTNWPKLKPYVAHIHVKDAMKADGKVVPAGAGDGHLEPIIKDAYASGYRGFLSLEPHLSAAGKFSGFSGPELFKVAVTALRELCGRAGVPLATKA
jgi:sugar phosphate isomerase/epimerase